MTKNHNKLTKANALSAILGIFAGLTIGFTGGNMQNPGWTSVDHARILTCFTPQNQCLQEILPIIENAKNEILVQAYYLTSMDITKAIINQHKAGISVKIILDKSQKDGVTIKLLQENGIPVYIDKVPGIAHNKVMIVDEEMVITGSYNFTYSAEKRNAENLILINSAEIASIYKQNWLDSKKRSIKPATRKAWRNLKRSTRHRK